MASAPITMQVTPGQLPPGVCPQSLQQQFNLFAANLAITFPLSAGIYNYGNTTPEPDYQSFPWFRLNSDGTPDRWYVYANGSWVAPHPVPPNSPILFPYNGTLASLVSYDGGESSTSTTQPSTSDDTGQMWSVATTDGNFPNSTFSNVIGYGQFLLGQSATYAQGATGGQMAATLTFDQIPPHTHPSLPPQTGFLCTGSGGGGGQGSNQWGPQTTTGYSGGVNTQPGVPGTTNPVPTIPAYLSVYYISRTSRVFYRAS